MNDLFYIDRATKQKCKEEVYGKRALSLLYGNACLSRIFAFFFLPIIAKCPVISRIYGYLQKRPSSRKKIIPFIKKYQIDTNEFHDPIESFFSFNDFFIRKLDPKKRAINLQDNIATAPVDGRYLVIPRIDREVFFEVKGKKFDLSTFLQDAKLAKQFAGGSLVLARLNPTDYHRFHFPVSGQVLQVREVGGDLFSVSPLALKKRMSILWENKRFLTLIESTVFGRIVMAEIGATCVGTIHQTFSQKEVKKGEEKGYFSFGGSSVVLLFEKNKIHFDEDLLKNSAMKFETKCLYGQSLGTVF